MPSSKGNVKYSIVPIGETVTNLLPEVNTQFKSKGFITGVPSSKLGKYTL